MIVLMIYFQLSKFFKIDSHARNFGVVHDLPASAWDSYMPVADHPEYPSLSASVCAAHAEVSRAFLGNDKTELEPFLFIKVYLTNTKSFYPPILIAFKYRTLTK